MTVIAIDVGATGIQAGFGGWSDRPVPVADDPTPGSAADLVDYLRETVVDLAARARDVDRSIEAVAVALPGTLSAAGRLTTSLHTGFAGLDLDSALGADLDCPLVVANDTNAQALGCATADETLCYVALGTGVGGAIVDDGHLFAGANGYAGEIGHVGVSGSDRDCVCGKTGCLYTRAAGEAIAADLGASWWRGDLSASARERVEAAGRAVGEAAATAATLVDPDRVVLTGHLTGYEPFATGLDAAPDHPFADLAVETVPETWPFARDGLAALARDADDG